MDDVREQWWARAWSLAPLCLAGVLLLDALLPRTTSYLLFAVGDELAHVLTTGLGLLALAAAARGALPNSFAAGALVAGNLIDADHLPLMLGNDILTEGTPRPYSHSLTFVLALVVLGRLSQGWVAAALMGAAYGLAGHLLRDLGTGSVALLWPVTHHGFDIPYLAYAIVLTIGACAATLLRSRSVPSEETASPARDVGDAVRRSPRRASRPGG
jgi:inner membrane protein